MPSGLGDSTAGPRVRRAGFALADQLVASATNVLTGIIIGRACTQGDFGLYMLGFTLVFVGIRLQNALIATPYMVFSPRMSRKTHAEFTASSLVHQFALSMTTVLVLVIGALLLSSQVSPPGLSRVVWALVFASSFILLREFARQLCFANLAFATAVILDIVVAIVQLGSLVLLAVLDLLSPALAFLVAGAACGLACVLWFLKWQDFFLPDCDIVVSHLKENWIFGRWIFFSVLTWEISVQIYPWCITYFHGTTSTGLWAACIGAVGLANPLILGLQNYLGPAISHAFACSMLHEFRVRVTRLGVSFFVLLLPVFVVLLIFGGKIVVILYGQKYGENGAVVAILALNLLTFPIQNTLSRALIAMERVKLEFLSNLVSLAAFFVFGWWLVRMLGPLGAAYAMLLSSVALSVTKYAFFLKALARP